MFKENCKLRMTQRDGGFPILDAAGSAPGENGVFVFSARFHGGVHVRSTLRRHGHLLSPHSECSP
jgi:hypothetical protein